MANHYVSYCELLHRVYQHNVFFLSKIEKGPSERDPQIKTSGAAHGSTRHNADHKQTVMKKEC